MKARPEQSRQQSKSTWVIRLGAGLGLVLGLLAGVFSPNLGSQAAQLATGAVARPPVLVLRLYFHDMAERDRLATEWSAVEMPTTGGYLTIWGDQATYDAIRAEGLRVEIDKETTAQANNNPVQWASPGSDTFDGGYKTVEEMQTFLDQKVAANPGLAEKIDVGNSWCKDHAGSCTQPNAYNGYDQWALHITNRAIPGPKPVFWYDAGIHSREIATPEIAMRYISWLLDNYATNADAHWLVDWQDIWVMPMLNPDGHHIVEAGGSSPYSQRKNANNTNGCTRWPPTSTSQYGTDNNRNFPFLWACCGGSSAAACDQTYRGPSANSDPETQYVVAKIRSLIADQRGPNNTDPAPLNTTGVVMSMHSNASLNLYPWGWTTTASPNDADLANIGQHMSATNAAPAGNGYQSCASPNCLYAVDGDSLDWAYGELGAASYTTEVEGSSFFPTYSTIDSTIWPRNQGMLTYLTKIAGAPYLLTRGPDSKTLAVSPASVPQGTPAHLTATLNYAWTGNSYSQNVAAAEYYVDTPPWAGGTAVAMTAADGAFNSPTEGAAADVPTGSLSAGQHILFVRGRGVNSYSGNLSWGPISAIFLTVTVSGPTNTPTNTPTPGPTFTPTNTPTQTPTATNTPTPGACGETLTNGGFESGTSPWVQSASNGHAIIDTSRPHTGTHNAHLGGYNRATDTIYQQVTIPATATSATLSYWWYMTTQETTHPFDFMYAQVLNSSGTVLATVQTLNDGSTKNAWTQATFNLLAYKGQTIRINFRVTTDTSLLTNFYVDDVSLNVCQ